MRKITNDAHDAFIKEKRFNLSNTRVEVIYENGVYMTLFGNTIAKKTINGVYISDGGYGWSKTTAERLSAFTNRLRGVKGEWILDEKSVWDGKWLKINQE